MNRNLAVFLALTMLLAHVLAIQIDELGNFAFPHDQAYAVFEYARNLAMDGKLHWGESGGAGEGYPSLAWILIAQLGERFTNHVNLFCQTIGILCGLLTVYLLSRIRPNRIAGLIAPLCFVTSGIAATACGSGTEIALYTLACMLCYWSAERDHPWRLALGLLLLVTSRVEGSFVAMALLLIYAPKLRTRGWSRTLAPFLVAALGVGLCALAWARSTEPWLPFHGLLKPLPGQYSEGWLSLLELLRTTSIPLLIVFPLAGLIRGRLGGMGARALLLAVLLLALGVAGGRSPLVFSQAFAVAMPLLYIAVQEGLIVALDARMLLRRTAIGLFAACLFTTGLASRGNVDLGPVPLGSWQLRWMQSSGSARAGYDAPLARAGLIEELKNTERLRSVGLYLRQNMPADTRVLSPWPAAIAYISRLEVHDLLGRTNPIPYHEPRGVWTRRTRVDIAHALREQLPVIIPRIRPVTSVPTTEELASEWISEFDTPDQQPEREAEIRSLLEHYSLITVPIQSFVRALVQPPPEPFHLLVLRSATRLPELTLTESNGWMRVLCKHQSPLLSADLSIRLQSTDGSSRWLDPTGRSRVQPCLARTDLWIGDSGSREFELMRFPLTEQDFEVRAQLLNPGASGTGSFDVIGAEARWQRP